MTKAQVRAMLDIKYDQAKAIEENALKEALKHVSKADVCEWLIERAERLAKIRMD